MNNDSGIKPQSERTLALARVLLILAAVLYPLLRFSQLGHLLTWDEAMNICAARSFVSLGQDDFSNWFWRHPPLYSLLTLLLAPLRSGFVTRVEIFNIVLGGINLSLLYLLNRRLFGNLTASVSALILATMPGSVFFDIWIKRDHLVVTFALLSLYLIQRKHLAFAALTAGLAFLSKETFIFLYPTVLLSALASTKGRRRISAGALMTILPALVSFWWFIIASKTGGLSSIRQHIDFATRTGPEWAGGISFYPSLIATLTGPIGAFILIFGIVYALTAAVKSQHRSLLWPVAPIFACIIPLSLIPPKVPWLVIVLLPAIATTQGIAVSAALQLLSRRLEARILFAAAAIAAAAIVSIPALGHSHEMMLRSVSPNQYRGASRSRSIARIASDLITDSDRMLLTSFHYWKGAARGQMCPVFTCYFKPKPLVLAIPHETPFEEIVRLITEHQIGWALVSPEPGEAEKDVIGGFIQDMGFTPASTGYACIFDTRNMLKTEKVSGVLDEITEAAE